MSVDIAIHIFDLPDVKLQEYDLTGAGGPAPGSDQSCRDCSVLNIEDGAITDAAEWSDPGERLTSA